MFFMQDPDLKKTGPDPLPLIKERRRQMTRKVERGRRREEKRSGAKLRSHKNRKEAARKKRQDQRQKRMNLKQEENRAQQRGKASLTKQASLQTEADLPPRKHPAKPQKCLPKSVKKILMAAPYNAGKRSMSKKKQNERINDV